MAHAHKNVVIFHFFQELSSKKKIKALRPKMTKIASRGPALKSKKGDKIITIVYFKIPGPSFTKWHKRNLKLHFSCWRSRAR